MRKTLFRGKSIATGKWIEGDLRTYRNGAREIIKTDIEWADGTHDAVLFPVDPNTVVQFINRKDKNGRMVFEKDIVKDMYGRIGVIEWHDKKSAYSFCFTKPHIENINFTCSLLNSGAMQVLEVIGNIHDNPELLEGTV